MMALGGIPVSGGATGHGTLISTNLLYSPLMLDEYGNRLATPAFVLGGTPGDTGYSADFAIDQDSKTLWKTGASAGDILFTMIHAATPPTVYGVVIIGHNLTSINTHIAHLEGGNGDYLNEFELVINAAALTPAYHLLNTPVAYTNWRIAVRFTSSTALQIGEVFLIGAPPLVFDRNYIKGFIPELELGKIITEGIGGVKRIETQWQRLRYEFEFADISITQLTALQLAALNGYVIFSPMGVNSRAYLGTLELQQPKNISAKSLADSTYSIIAAFTEAAL